MIIEEVKTNRQTLVEAFGDSIAAHQRITLGRNAADMSPEEYLEELFRATRCILYYRYRWQCCR